MNRIFKAVLIGFVLIASLFPVAKAGASDDLTLEDMAKTEAARLFLAKDYQGSLAEFQKMESEHPANGMIKRYMASIYDKLRDQTAAIEKLNQALAIDPSDLIAHQMIGDVYIKIAEFDQAEKHFQYILEHQKDGAVAQYAQRQIDTIRAAQSSAAAADVSQLSAQNFMRSEPAQQFSKGRYQEALRGFLELQSQYPKDVLVARFVGISYMKLGKIKEAEKALQDTIAMDPKNAAAYFYLGQAYAAGNNMEKARESFRWVIENDRGPYNARAQQAVFSTLRQGANASSKPWSVTASAGYNFDTNATFKSSDDDFSSAGDQNSGKYSNVLTGSYRFYQKKRWFFTGDALYAQTIYNDFPHLNTYTPGAGVSALYAFNLFNKPSYLNFREGATMTVLKNTYYVWTNTVSSSLITNLNDRYRATVSHRWSVDQFHDNGLTPDVTSRDGYGHTFAILNTHYLNAEKTFYWTHGYDFEHHGTRGVNYVRNLNIGRVGIHKTLLEKIEGDITFSFKDANYYKFTALPRRRDGVYSLTVTLSRPLNQYLTLSGSYTFEDSRAKNNAYEYIRHDIGVKLGLKY